MASTLQDILRTADQAARFAKSNYRSTSKKASRQYEDASEYAGEIAAEALESAAQIARGIQKNAGVVQGSVTSLVRERPIGALLIAVAIGAMIGFAARR